MGEKYIYTFDEWINFFNDSRCRERLTEIYGDDEALIRERILAYKTLLSRFDETFGKGEQAVISRSPGRINLMGKHTDHQGGYANVMAINREILCMASPRSDDTVCIANTDPLFRKASFSISQCFGGKVPDNWFEYLESDIVKESFFGSEGHWVHYVKGAVLRLQAEFKDKKLRGMNMVYSGNIPVSAGLSGSSALVVSTLEACTAVNGINLSKNRFVELCGEGEWYVGLNNGISDPAAMKYAEKGRPVKLAFKPFSYVKTFDFPKGYKIVVADSLIKANKTGNAKNTYNMRVATYGMGMILLRELFPEKMKYVEHLRDIQSGQRGFSSEDIYRMLLSFPESIALKELLDRLPEKKRQEVHRLLKTHTPAIFYPIRGVMLYGIAECHRARLCSDLIEEGNTEEFGRWMSLCHDGDRVAYTDENGKMIPYKEDVSDSYLLERIEDLQSGDPERIKRSALERQKGSYACSVPEIDYMVDKALRVEGVLGAQISGAGLGGCMMALARNDAVSTLKSFLEKEYYAPRGLEPQIFICSPVKGSGCLVQ